MIRTFAIATIVTAFALQAQAQSTDSVENLDATLLPGWQIEGGTHMAGLQLQLAPGWKTYWRSPGAAGIPPLFDWSGSDNVKSVRVHWPRPVVFLTNGLQSIGYHDAVTLPLEVTPNDATKPMILRAQVDLGICRDICLPAAVDVRVALTAPGAMDAAINAALKSRAATASEAGLAAIRCRVDPIADGLRLTAVMDLPTLGPQETVVFEAAQPDIWVSEAIADRSGGQLTAAADLVAPSGTPFALDRSQVRVTVIAGDNAVEIRGCPAS